MPTSPRKIRRGPCRHCERPDQRLAGRELCQPCYRNKEVRARYALMTADEIAADDELTEEELDAMIAVQAANLPSWWDDDRPGNVEDRVYERVSNHVILKHGRRMAPSTWDWGSGGARAGSRRDRPKERKKRMRLLATGAARAALLAVHPEQEPVCEPIESPLPLPPVASTPPDPTSSGS